MYKLNNGLIHLRHFFMNKTQKTKMKKLKFLAPLLTIAFVAIFLQSCGVKKMIKDAPKVSYESTPKPLEVHADSIKINITGSFPAKYFHKKAVLTVIPVVKYKGGEKELKSIVLRGEKVEGEGSQIGKKEGGKFSYKDQFLFVSGMEQCEIELRPTIQFKSKTNTLPAIKVNEGAITTPLLVKAQGKTIIEVDKFDKTPTIVQKANIYFVVDQYDIREVELKSDEVTSLDRFITKGAADSSEFQKLDIYGYASPEGELKRNAFLAEQRADAAYKLVAAKMNKAKIKAIKNKGFYEKFASQYEDWDGLKNLLSKSNEPSKDQAIGIINNIMDPEQREAEFRKQAFYDPIYETYFPKLRRAEINLVVNAKIRPDALIKDMAVNKSDELGLEELLYGASLQDNDDNKLKVYQNFTRRFPEDYRGFSNAGVILLNQGNLAEAESQLDKAKRVSNNATVNNNLGVLNIVKGDKVAAAEFLNAAGNIPEAQANKGVLAIKKGKYADAVSNFGSDCSYNAALAKLLAGNTSGALQTIDCSDEKETADGFYLKAVIAARSSNKEGVANNLSQAFAKNPSLKAKAATDLEFAKYQDVIK